MTLEELKQREKVIRANAEKEIAKVRHEYAIANNPYKVGDVFTDHVGSIKIEKIIPYYDSLMCKPICQYVGVILNKDGKPNKKSEIRSAYQFNDINKKTV